MTPVRARRCPNCTGLLSETITGELTDPDFILTCLECGQNSVAHAWALGEWRPAEFTSDSSDLGGSIVGVEEGAAFKRDSVLVDTRNAVLMDALTVATTTMERGTSRRGVALQMQGRVNLTTRRSNVLYLMDEDGCAALVAEVTAIVVREGREFQAAFEHALAARLEAMPTEEDFKDA